MHLNSIDGLCTSNGSKAGNEFLKGYNMAVVEQKNEQELWIELLRKDGYKAAHPDDGWVNRKENKVLFTHPHFNDECKVGDKIVLGWANYKQRSVVITDIKDAWWLGKDSSGRYKYLEYSFEEIPNSTKKEIDLVVKEDKNLGASFNSILAIIKNIFKTHKE